MHKRSIAPLGYEETISHSGHRLTPQRKEVYNVLVSEPDHPTASEVFIRAKKHMPGISLATVYNCLETLVACGLAKQVNVVREATRYCPNLEEHGHFICDECGSVSDVPVTGEGSLTSFINLPPKFTITQSEITLRGTCPDCKTIPVKN